MARFSLAHAGEPIIVGSRQLYLDPARLIKQAFLPSGVDGVAESLFHRLGGQMAANHTSMAVARGFAASW